MIKEAGACAMETGDVCREKVFQCPDGCPGCRRNEMTYEECAKEKHLFVVNTLSQWKDRIGEIETAPLPMRLGYRSRVCLAAEHDGTGWRLGLKKRNRVLAVHDCPIHSTTVRNAANILAKAIPPPDAFALCFYVQSGAQVTLVVKSRAMPDIGWLDDETKKALEATGIEGLWINLHPSAGRRVFAKSGWRLVWGKELSQDPKKLWYGPATFMQVAGPLFERAANEAETFLAPKAEDLVIDLYCGIGATLAMWTKRGSRVVGVERCGQSVRCAALNAPRATIFQGACADRIPQLEAEKLKPHARRLVYVNPPGTGIENKVTGWITETFRPRRIAYLSCNAATARRDLLMMENNRYEVCRIIPYDFFPNTRHVECLALLSAKEHETL